MKKTLKLFALSACLSLIGLPCLYAQTNFNPPQQGPPGPAGATGMPGTPGTDGTNGAAGTPGTDGTNGATGPTGATGSSGASAFFSGYKVNGFSAFLVADDAVIPFGDSQAISASSFTYDTGTSTLTFGLTGYYRVTYGVAPYSVSSNGCAIELKKSGVVVPGSLAWSPQLQPSGTSPTQAPVIGSIIFSATAADTLTMVNVSNATISFPTTSNTPESVVVVFLTIDWIGESP